MAHSVHDPVMLRHTLHLHNTIPQARVTLAGNTSHRYNHTSHNITSLTQLCIAFCTTEIHLHQTGVVDKPATVNELKI